MRIMSQIKNKSELNSVTNNVSNVVDIFDDRYYKINKQMLRYVGLWPYQSFFARGVMNSLVVIMSISLLGPQLLKFEQSWSMGEIGVFIECFSPFIVNIGCDIKVFSHMFHKQKLKRILEEIRNEWKYTRTYMPELKILQEHGQIGRSYTISYITMVYLAVAAWATVPLIPFIMDIVVPLNESRPYVPYFQADYRVDPDKYFYPIYIHSIACTVLGMGVFVATDTTFTVFSQHACAILDIVRYRLENIIQEDDRATINTTIGEDIYYQKLVDCIMKHKHSIEFIQLMQSMYEWYVMIVMFLSILVISATGSQLVAKGTSTEDTLRFAFFTIAQIFHLFCYSLPGDRIMDTSSLLPTSAYSCRWYLMSPRSQKLIVLFISHSLKPCTIVAGKMYVMSLENFRRVLQTSLSYLTILASMQ